MAYTDDWENLMNGVFGPGGKLRFDTQKTPPEKPGLPDMNAALLEQQKKLDEMLKDLNGPWSNAACMGYCLIAMRRAGLRPTAQRRVLRVLEGVFDDVSVEKAEKAGYDNTEE